MKADFYNDDEFSYTDYWQERAYENESEEMAVRRMLGKSKFDTAVDVGGGFGRLTAVIASFSRQTLLVEPSEKMRNTAKKHLSGKNIKITRGTTVDTGLTDKSVDLYTSFRVFHHLPDLQPTFSEIKRVLRPNGKILIEFANSLNFKSRVRSWLSGKDISKTPVEMRSAENIKINSIAFVNHHPKSVLRTFANNGFEVEKILSVSNFRLGVLKKFVPFKLLLVLEFVFQPILSEFYFGPSVFVLASRVDKNTTL